jgi:hypothetical protein
VWWRLPTGTGPAATDLADLLGGLSAETAPACAGLIADADPAGPAVLETLLAAVPAGQVRVRLAVRSGGAAPTAWLQPLTRLRESADLAVAWPASGTAIFVPISADRDLSAAVTAASSAGEPVLVEVAVSVGRTSAEASARAAGEELFTAIGHPREQGLFGTLEECQSAAAMLAHAGATELVCYLPQSHDLADVLAQLRAVSIGAGLLRPGEPGSSPPPPPAGWGGRRSLPS